MGTFESKVEENNSLCFKRSPLEAVREQVLTTPCRITQVRGPLGHLCSLSGYAYLFFFLLQISVIAHVAVHPSKRPRA